MIVWDLNQGAKSYNLNLTILCKKTDNVQKRENILCKIKNKGLCNKGKHSQKK